MKPVLILLFLFSFSGIVLAQRDTLTDGTITVKKKRQKATLVDQVRGRLVLVDQYGKILDSSRVVSFEVVIAINEKMTTFPFKGAYFDHEIKDQLMLAADGTIFYIKNVKAKNSKGEIESYPSTVIKVDGRRAGNDTIYIQPILDTYPTRSE